ncbi:hypothetical protein NC653_013904 [Populus alba x Populus x berolinensis]|uniref:Uncharacterized protein n=1 Tax=Populus alba x Populus x berolinensis TaxID=444605 RepID=A0AAD6QVH0_9ROSI|nr:hypothetical protein NC653_013884 [Populus alba x Populus x berolinensis]KAJ6997479.1 hypothetical protein NC653_013904 [Populus alba x Populus x berolinensis]
MVGCWSRRGRSLQRRGEARNGCNGFCHWTTTCAGGIKRKEEKRRVLLGMGRGQLALLLTDSRVVGENAANK